MKKSLVIITAFICALLLSITIQAQTSPPVISFYNKTDGQFRQEGGSNIVSIINKNKSLSQGIQLTNSAGQSVYYARSVANQPNKYICEARQHQSIEYLSNDRIKYADANKNTSTFFNRKTKVIQPPVVVFHDKTEGKFKQEGGSNIVSMVNKTKSLSQGIQLTNSSGQSVYYARSVANRPNKYVCEDRQHQSIEYLSNDRIKYADSKRNTSVFFNRHTEVNPPIVSPPASYTFKVDGNDNIKKVALNKNLSREDLSFSLSTSSQITWWKGIKIFDRNDKMICLLSTQDNDHGPKLSKTFNAQNFGSKVKVEFWKAKTFGVHTHIETKYFSLSELQGLSLIHI